MLIVTKNVCPPIPIRFFDWCAYQAGAEEDGPFGWGSTETKAIENLNAILEEEDV